MKGHRWKIRRRKGASSVELRPVPEMREVTYDLFERVCILLGVDPDQMFRGAVGILDVETPPLSKAQPLLEMLTTNAARFDVREMPPDRVEALLGVLVADFFLRALRPGTSNIAIGGI